MNPPRLLFLQASCAYETYGGVEYFQHDFLELFASVWGKENVLALAPQRNPNSVFPKEPFVTEPVPYPKNRWLQKLQNRLPVAYYSMGSKKLDEFRPTILMCGHVSLAPITRLLAKKNRLPYGVNVHGIEVWGKFFPQDRWGLEGADLIMPTGNCTKRILVERGFDEKKIHVVHPKLSSEFEYLKIPERKAARTFHLLTVSRLDAGEKYKGHDHVLQALSLWRKRSPESLFHYSILGDGSDKTRLVALAQKLGISERVEFRPPARTRTGLVEAFQNADVFVMPSRFGFWENKWRGEGFGIAFLEASSFGLPLITYRCGGQLDIVQHEQNGLLIEPDDVEGLSRSIENLATDAALRTRLGQQGYQLAREKFGREAISQEIRAMIRGFDAPS